MNCEILRTLYVKANGEIPCNDDFGERLSLGWVEPGFSLRALFAGEPYVRIREALRRGEPPWPDVCGQCAFLRPLQPTGDSLAVRRVRQASDRSVVGVRPSMSGLLARPAVQTAPGRQDPFAGQSGAVVPDVRPRTVCLGLDRILRSGRTLSHPHFDEIVSLGRRHLPGTRQRLITNGNYAFRSKIKTPLDEIIVSCDGFFPESYAQYRIGGSVQQVLAFIADAVAASRGRTTVIWKYIVFASNDSDAEIRAAEQAAIAMGVDTLLFVFTHSPQRSARFTSENRHELLRLAPRASVSTTLVQQRLDRHGCRRPLSAWGRLRAYRRRSRGLLHAVDEVQLLSGAQIYVRGWIAWDGKPVQKLEVRCNGRLLGQALLGMSRRDVTLALPAVTDDHVGFAFSAPVSTGGADNLRIELCVTSLNGRTSRIESAYALSCDPH